MAAASARGIASITTLSTWRNSPCSLFTARMVAGSCSIARSAAPGLANGMSSSCAGPLLLPGGDGLIDRAVGLLFAFRVEGEPRLADPERLAAGDDALATGASTSFFSFSSKTSVWLAGGVG